MTTTKFNPPVRHELTDRALQRPDWTKSAARDPQLLWLDKNENADPVLRAITSRVLREVPCRPTVRLLGQPLEDVPVRLALEKALRQLARWETDRNRQIALVDRANALRAVTWV